MPCRPAAGQILIQPHEHAVKVFSKLFSPRHLCMLCSCQTPDITVSTVHGHSTGDLCACPRHTLCRYNQSIINNQISGTCLTPGLLVLGRADQKICRRTAGPWHPSSQFTTLQQHQIKQGSHSLHAVSPSKDKTETESMEDSGAQQSKTGTLQRDQSNGTAGSNGSAAAQRDMANGAVLNGNGNGNGNGQGNGKSTPVPAATGMSSSCLRVRPAGDLTNIKLLTAKCPSAEMTCEPAGILDALRMALTCMCHAGSDPAASVQLDGSVTTTPQTATLPPTSSNGNGATALPDPPERPGLDAIGDTGSRVPGLDERILSGEFTDAGSTKERWSRPVRKWLAKDRLTFGIAP